MSLPLALPEPVAEEPYISRDYRKIRAKHDEMLEERRRRRGAGRPGQRYGLLNMFPTRAITKLRGSDGLRRARRLSPVVAVSGAGPVQIEVNIAGKLSDKPVEVYNTVAEIRGTEKPDEVVIIGGHLDSWDLGTGATDNGTGSMAVLEAARALQKLGVKPKRTIRFVLFTGEEQGLNGSKAYVKAHASELGKISGVLVHDSGTGKVLTVGLMANYAAREKIDHALYPLAKAPGIELAEPSLRSEGGSDHVPFDEAGVPASGACKTMRTTTRRTIRRPIRWTACAGTISPKVRRCWPCSRTTSRSFRTCCRESRRSPPA